MNEFMVLQQAALGTEVGRLWKSLVYTEQGFNEQPSGIRVVFLILSISRLAGLGLELSGIFSLWLPEEE